MGLMTKKEYEAIMWWVSSKEYDSGNARSGRSGYKEHLQAKISNILAKHLNLFLVIVVPVWFLWMILKILFDIDAEWVRIVIQIAAAIYGIVRAYMFLKESKELRNRKNKAWVEEQYYDKAQTVFHREGNETRWMVEQINRFEEKLGYGEDTEYLYETAANGQNVIVPWPQYFEWKEVQDNIRNGKYKPDPSEKEEFAGLYYEKKDMDIE